MIKKEDGNQQEKREMCILKTHNATCRRSSALPQRLFKKTLDCVNQNTKEGSVAVMYSTRYIRLSSQPGISYSIALFL